MSERAQRSGTQVEIYGSSYVVRGEHDPTLLQELAAVVDGKMREIAARAASPEVGRLAILAALNLADELHRCKQEQDGERVEIEARMSELARELGTALEG